MSKNEMLKLRKLLLAMQVDVVQDNLVTPLTGSDHFETMKSISFLVELLEYNLELMDDSGIISF